METIADRKNHVRDLAVLPENIRRAILEWSELAAQWGLKRVEAQIHALLFLSPHPLDAEEISKTLSAARSHVSNGLKELQRQGIVRRVPVHGRRREHFESIKDVWDICRALANEKKRRSIEPCARMLRRSAAELEPTGDHAYYARQKLSEMAELFETLSTWQEEAHKLPTPMFRTFMKMGGMTLRLFELGGNKCSRG